MDEPLLTSKEAYRSMILFLERYYELTSADDIGGLLGSMALTADESTMDPAMWDDWLDAIRVIERQRNIKSKDD